VSDYATKSPAELAQRSQLLLMSPADMGRDLRCSRSLPQTCAEVSAVRKSDYPTTQILEHPECTSITAVLPGAPVNTLVESESTVQSSRGAWEHLEVNISTDKGYWRVPEFCAWLPD